MQEIKLTEASKIRIATLIQNRSNIDNQINEMMVTILETKEIDIRNKTVSIKEDLTAIVVEDTIINKEEK